MALNKFLQDLNRAVSIGLYVKGMKNGFIQFKFLFWPSIIISIVLSIVLTIILNIIF